MHDKGFAGMRHDAGRNGGKEQAGRDQRHHELRHGWLGALLSWLSLDVWGSGRLAWPWLTLNSQTGASMYEWPHGLPWPSIRRANFSSVD